MFEMCTTIKLCGLLYLLAGTIVDIRIKKVPVLYLTVGTVSAVISQIYEGKDAVWLCLMGGVVGLIFFAVSYLTRESFGYGDSWMIGILGVFLGVWQLFAVLGTAFFIAGLTSIVGLMSKKWTNKVAIPFYPFLTIAYVGAMLL